MAIKLLTNTAALKVQRALATNSRSIDTSLTRLSTGLRINKASDDAAGLAIADQLRSDTRIAITALRNANDGVSLIQVADSALGEIGSILIRMAELSEQSANGLYNTQSRSAFQNEFSELASEITRISRTTSFNDIALISGGKSVTFQVGFNSSSLSSITYFGVEGTLHRLGLGDGGEQLSYSVNAETDDSGRQAALTALAAVNEAIGELSHQRGLLGATESRLETAINNLDNSVENFKAAESRIRDADVAVEAANLTRHQLLQQTGVAVLAQANQQPLITLSLLEVNKK